MAFNIQNFISHIGKYKELAHASRFEVRIPLPSSLRGSSFGTRELSFQCEGAEFPGRNISMIEYRHHAFTQRVPHVLSYTDVNLVFMCNNQFLEKKFFDSWMNSMIPSASGMVQYFRTATGENNFSSEIVIRQYSGQKEGAAQLDSLPIYGIKLIDAIPTSVAPLSLSWADESYHRLQVSFTFKKAIPLSYRRNFESGYNRETTEEAASTAIGDFLTGNRTPSPYNPLNISLD
ncbi:MAG: hypothetical protein ACO3YM_07345 [Candidatus Kapaibacteriota bacterium]